VQLSQPDLYRNCRFKISTKSMYEIQFICAKLSNFISSSKFLNIDQMLICLFASMHFYALQYWSVLVNRPVRVMEPTWNLADLIRYSRLVRCFIVHFAFIFVLAPSLLHCIKSLASYGDSHLLKCANFRNNCTLIQLYILFL
jgi:hypothetical protein